MTLIMVVAMVMAMVLAMILVPRRAVPAPLPAFDVERVRFVPQHAAHHGDVVFEGGGRRHHIDGANVDLRSALALDERNARAEDDASEARPADGAHAHATGLRGGVELEVRCHRVDVDARR